MASKTLIPVRKARIEWNKDGPFRVSDWSDPPSRELQCSGGACFKIWREMPAADEAAIVAWLFHHALIAMEDGCDSSQVLDELSKVGVRFDFNELMWNQTYVDDVKLRPEAQHEA